MFDNIVILIPALNPDEKLISYTRELVNAGFSKILIVDDGSIKNKEIFAQLKYCCKVLTHAINMGKGRALKTGINYILNNYISDDIVGIITADSDGQHCVTDTIKIAKALCENHQIVLGCRDFSGNEVPPKSKFGNNLTMYLFAFLYGKKIGDTQTGLRGLAYEVLPEALSYSGERYEYEMHMLIEAVVNKRDIIEVPIETIYYEGNKETHFSVVADSIKIYRVLLGRGAKYIFSSLCGFGVDILIFTVLVTILLSLLSSPMAILLSTVVARFFSGITNYFINRKVVFGSNDKVIISGGKYFLLMVVQLLFSWFLVTFLYIYIQGNATFWKIFVDTCLFFVSYKIQHKWIFLRIR